MKYVKIRLMKKFIFYTVLFLLFIALISGIRVIFLSRDYIPIRHVMIDIDSSAFSYPRFTSIIHRFVNDKSLLSVDIEGLRLAIQKIPGIEDVHIERIWPDQLNVHILTLRPIARFNQTRYVNAYGELFKLPYLVKAPLPSFFGDAQETLKILNEYQQINAILEPLLLKIDVLKIYPEQSWKVLLNNGVRLNIDAENALDQIDRFVKVYPKLILSHSMLPKIVDLRYKQGLAVQW